MRFIDREQLIERFSGKSVAIVGSGPGVLDNEPGFVDGHDVVVRVNSYKLGPAAGRRADAHYSFYGSSIRKTEGELRNDGVTMCLCKCPEAQFMDSDWHRRMNKPHGVDFRYIYRDRARWWWTDTYVPDLEEFMATFEMLGRHVPTTGFSAIQLVLGLGPASVYLTGFDGFRSGVHNVNEKWRPGNASDPIGHAPERELQWLRENSSRFTSDPMLTGIIKGER